MTTGEKIRNARKAQHLSQKELADRMGVNQSHVSQYENDYKSPSLETLSRFANAIGCDIGDLIVEKKVINTRNVSLSDMVLDSLDQNGLPFSDDEIDLVDSYRSLNKSGKNRLSAYASDLAKIPDYTAPDSE